MLLNPRFAPSASVAFTLVGRLLQRVPRSHQLSLRMTFPCQGQGYQCLSLFADYERRHVCDFNLLSGRFHVCEAFENGNITAVSEWPNERNYLLAFLAEDHSLDSILDDVLDTLGIPGTASPNFAAGCMAITMGAVLARFIFDPEPVQVENGWANDKVWPEWLDSVPEDCMLSKPYLDWAAGRLWRLRFRDRSVLFDDEIVYLNGTDKNIDVCNGIGRSEDLAALAAARIEAHLRGTVHPSVLE